MLRPPSRNVQGERRLSARGCRAQAIVSVGAVAGYRFGVLQHHAAAVDQFHPQEIVLEANE
jgi:hypothetical protein